MPDTDFKAWPWSSPPVDISRIRVGDRVAIWGVVVDTEPDTRQPVLVTHDDQEFWAFAADICAHEPRGFKPGDRVKFKRNTFASVGVVVATDGDMIWVKRPKEDGGHCTYAASDLTHED